MMNLEIVGFETAKLAKQLGFDIPTLDFYGEPDKSFYEFKEGKNYQLKNHNDVKECGSSVRASAPTKSVLKHWLLENHKIWIEELPLAEDLKHGLYWNVRRCDLRLGRVLIETINGTGEVRFLIERALKKALEKIKSDIAQADLDKELA